MRVCDEDFLDPAHLHGALLYLVLRRLAAVKQPDIAVEPQGERGVVARRRGLGGRGAQESDVQRGERGMCASRGGHCACVWARCLSEVSCKAITMARTAHTSDSPEHKLRRNSRPSIVTVTRTEPMQTLTLRSRGPRTFDERSSHR